MKILMLAPVEERVPPRKYGGTELVVYNLTEGLVKRGYQVTLAASGDSITSAKLYCLSKKSLRIRLNKQNHELKLREAFKYIAIARALKLASRKKFDIVHNHIGWRILPFSFFIKMPMITTLHGPLTDYYQKTVYSQFKKAHLVSISKSQRQPAPQLNYAGTVYNGIDLDKFIFNNKPQDYFAFLGRISPEKGIWFAIKAALRAKIKLLIGAKIDPVDQKFYQSKIKPLINGKQIQYLGELNHNQKVQLLKNARAVINPINWQEPFGLVMTEAMACGTPVIATRRASASEIIIDKKTGFLVDPQNPIPGIIKAVKNIDQIRRGDCRKRVEEKFTTDHMVAGYEKVYKKVIKAYKKQMGLAG
ncbi:MAG: glycosyltransferase family 4 protein [bacterium]